MNGLPSLHWDGALTTGAYLDTNVVSSVRTQTPLITGTSRRHTNTPWQCFKAGRQCPQTTQQDTTTNTSSPQPLVRVSTPNTTAVSAEGTPHESRRHNNNNSRPPHSKLAPDHVTSPQLPTSLIMVLIPSTPKPERYHISPCFIRKAWAP